MGRLWSGWSGGRWGWLDRNLSLPDHQQPVDVIEAEPTVASVTKTVRLEQPVIAPVPDRVGVHVEELGHLRYREHSPSHWFVAVRGHSILVLVASKPTILYLYLSLPTIEKIKPTTCKAIATIIETIVAPINGLPNIDGIEEKGLNVEAPPTIKATIPRINPISVNAKAFFE